MKSKRFGSPAARRVIAVAGITAVLSLTAACGNATTDNAVADRTLIWSTGTELGTFDAIADQVNGTARRLLVGSVLEGLTKIDKDDSGALQWSPLLATEWAQVDPNRWRFQIRDGVHFHDGSTLDVADVAYSINKVASPDSAKDNTLENLAGAEIVDDHTVDVLTHTPDFFVYRALAGVGIQPDGWGGAEAQNTAIGTGPYKVGEVTAAHDRVTLEAFDDYWGDLELPAETIQMNIVPDASARLAAVNAEEVDIAFDLGPDLLASAPASIASESTEVEALRISTAGVLADPRLREALNLVVDRDTLINTVRAGFAIPPRGQGVTSQVHGFNPDIDDAPYDPERAAQLVKEAGAVGATISLMCASDYYGTAGVSTCQTMASAFEGIGLVVDLQLLPRDQAAQQGLFAPRNGITPPDLFHFQIGSTTLDAVPFVQQYYMCEAVRATFCDDQLRSAAEAALALTDEAAQAEALEKVQAIAHKISPFVWLTSPEVVAATQEGVSGTLYSDASTIYWYEWAAR